MSTTTTRFPVRRRRRLRRSALGWLADDVDHWCDGRWWHVRMPLLLFLGLDPFELLLGSRGVVRTGRERNHAC